MGAFNWIEYPLRATQWYYAVCCGAIKRLKNWPRVLMTFDYVMLLPGNSVKQWEEFMAIDYGFEVAIPIAISTGFILMQLFIQHGWTSANYDSFVTASESTWITYLICASVVEC